MDKLSHKWEIYQCITQRHCKFWAINHTTNGYIVSVWGPLGREPFPSPSSWIKHNAKEGNYRIAYSIIQEKLNKGYTAVLDGFSLYDQILERIQKDIEPLLVKQLNIEIEGNSVPETPEPEPSTDYVVFYFSTCPICREENRHQEKLLTCFHCQAEYVAEITGKEEVNHG